MQINLSLIGLLINDRFLRTSSLGAFMNIIKTSGQGNNHPRPINAIPPMLWMQAAIITLGAFATMLSSTMLSARCPRWPPPWRDGHGNTMDSNGVSYALAAGVPLSAGRPGGLALRSLALCLILFAIFSAVLRPFPRFEVLLAARVMQGLAGGLLVPAGQNDPCLVVGRERLGRVIGTIGVAIVIAPLLEHRWARSCLKSADGEGYLDHGAVLSVRLSGGWKLLPRPTIKLTGPSP